MKYAISTIVLLLLLSMGSAFADVSTTGLTAKQKDDLAVHAATLKAENIGNTTGTTAIEILSNPDIMTKYAQMGEAIAKGIGAAARELGLEVNNFMTSPAGVLVTILLVYNFIGAELIKMFVGFIFMLPLTYMALCKVLFWIRL